MVDTYADPWVFEGLFSRNSLCWINGQHLIDQILCFWSHRVPLWGRKLGTWGNMKTWKETVEIDSWSPKSVRSWPVLCHQFKGTLLSFALKNLRLHLKSVEEQKSTRKLPQNVSFSLLNTHTQIPTAMRQESSDWINNIGPNLNWRLLNIQKVLSKPLHCPPPPHTHIQHTYIVCPCFDLLIEFVLIFIPEWRISN